MANVISQSVQEAGWAALPADYRIPDQAPSLAGAQAYCERLARSHYENFSVATWFLPKRLRQHFYNVYAYCRISDDLGDEVGNPQQSLAMLDEWERELDACYAGSPRHPVLVALQETVGDFDIPKREFSDLLVAFRQDQHIRRFHGFSDLLAYCRYSANPVGHLVLYLCGYRDEERRRLSDHTCTALQLANFWQDVTLDCGKGRIYIPLEDMQRFGVLEQQINERRFNRQFRELMRFEVARTREWFALGLPLIESVDPELAIDIELFTRGGQQVLNAIARQDFNVLRARPAISKPRKLGLLLRAAYKKASRR